MSFVLVRVLVRVLVLQLHFTLSMPKPLSLEAIKERELTKARKMVMSF
jgi:hypothetical protein